MGDMPDLVAVLVVQRLNHQDNQSSDITRDRSIVSLEWSRMEQPNIKQEYE
jgi:hypothetical protein